MDRVRGLWSHVLLVWPTLCMGRSPSPNTPIESGMSQVYRDGTKVMKQIMACSTRRCVPLARVEFADV